MPLELIKLVSFSCRIVEEWYFQIQDSKILFGQKVFVLIKLFLGDFVKCYMKMIKNRSRDAICLLCRNESACVKKFNAFKKVSVQKRCPYLLLLNH